MAGLAEVASKGGRLFDKKGKGGPMSPEEAAEMEAQLDKDPAALERAERTAQKLPHGHVVYSCPGCALTRTGLEGGPEFQLMKIHAKRHPSHGRTRSLAGIPYER